MKLPTLMKVDRVPVADIIVKDRLRPVTEAGVESLLASIAEVGVMKDPVHLRKKKDGKLVLIAGAHRLEAARRLGWSEIAASVWTDATDDWARLMEIDDNLAGAEMNALDTAVFLATRKAIYERLHPETKAGIAGGLARQGSASDIVSFAAATAEKFGVSKRHVERMVAAGARLGPDEVAKLRVAPRAITLKDLGEIGKIGKATDRYDVVRLLAEGKARSVSQARKQIAAEAADTPEDGAGEAPRDTAFNALINAWKRAPIAAKRRFIVEVTEDLEQLRAEFGMDRAEASDG